MQTRRGRLFNILVEAACLAPLAVLVWALVAKHLGPDWVGEATRRMGRYALTFLILSLVPGAIQRLSGWNGILWLRRTLGLYAFKYACLHLLVVVGIDYRFNFNLLAGDLPHSPFILVGLAALFLLAPLAITSTRDWMRRLGKNWRRLHRLVYVAAPVAVWHYAWRAKEVRPRSFWIFGVLASLLLVRLLPLGRLRRGRT